jgi:hypothetical protein
MRLATEAKTPMRSCTVKADEIAASMRAHLGLLVRAQFLRRATEYRAVLETGPALGDVGDIADHSRSGGVAAGAGPDISSSPRMSVSIETALVTPCTCAMTDAVGTIVGWTRCSMPLSVR